MTNYTRTSTGWAIDPKPELAVRCIECHAEKGEECVERGQTFILKRDVSHLRRSLQWGETL